ncbi:energy-coupling factor ABC transporter ATP-binding protein [Paenibacillus oenotherae]|uniref:Energy-coupling factor ABC transporter ATP-binding protein n=1 Tax=Paenibacillus oenotherae TaxID=1435645 RepID=A0ABS7D8D2_9BACL|nr:ABC transporter ATP-binding protein [Paenibacillus oenotherae]MBW7475797.1 energy-coupling factor ABC transporter ATP-binding protein [Paenibacillus oenotherae]
MALQSTEEQPIIQLDNVTFRYPGAEANSLEGVSLSIYRGDFIAIAGSNGSGKSTLCKCFNGLIPTYYSGDMEGTVFVDGIATAERSVAELSRNVAYVFQDFENQLVRPTVYDEACFAPLNFGYEDYKERGMNALRMLEIEHLRNEWIWQLSGGQKHMAALAAALALDPDVIVVDEPVAQLDPAHARVIYEKLKLLNERYGKTIVVIEHHTEFIADYCRKMVLMERGGRVRWVKSVAEGLSAVSELNEMNIQPPQVTQAFHALCREQAIEGALYPITIEEAALHWGSAAKRELPSTDAYASAASSSRSAGEPLVRFEGVISGYQGIDRKKKPILQGIDLSIHEGDRIALIGNNGAGKSTLLRLISGLRRPWEGKVTVCGRDTRKSTPEELSDLVAFLFQNPEEMFIADNIRQDVEYFLRARQQQGIEPFIEDVLRRFKLTELQQRDGRLLSGGQQRRTTLAIGMAMRPTIMLLDEPTASLDIASRKELTLLFDQLRDEVKAVVVATHDMQLVADWANRVIVMNEGRILLDTDSRTVFQHPDILDRAALVAPQIVQLCGRLGIEPACLSVEQFIAYMERAQREELVYGIG